MILKRIHFKGRSHGVRTGAVRTGVSVNAVIVSIEIDLCLRSVADIRVSARRVNRPLHYNGRSKNMMGLHYLKWVT